MSENSDRDPAGDRMSSASDGIGQEEEVPEPDSSFYPEYGINAGVVEELQQRYRADPSSVDASWEGEFRGRSFSGASVQESFVRPAGEGTGSRRSHYESGQAPLDSDPVLGLQTADRYARVLRLIHFYRARGHRIANTDPLGEHSTYFPELDPAHYGLGHEDMESGFITGDLPGGGVQTLSEILARLRKTYCGTIGAEYTHVQDPGRKGWLQERMEKTRNVPLVEDEERLRIFDQLSRAELFETFIHTRFMGQKRFSLEGAEAAVPMLDAAIRQAPSLGIREIVLGMSHRGRLNVLGNVLGKPYEAIFAEFQDNPLVSSPFGSGDVKYHKGYSTDRFVSTGERVHLTLTSNPSHLEAVNPVAVGRARAKQVLLGDQEGKRILPLLLHGDAAFAGQGMVAETLNLSQLSGYSTGGTLHLIINNQIGFTTTASEARSTLYCSDIAKMIQVPIFHVNGDDPEAVVHCIRLAMDYRLRFGDDVVIDLVCYRRHGHNEGDEPGFTQPRLYTKIRKRPPVRQLYGERLKEMGILSEAEAKAIQERHRADLNSAYDSIQSRPPGPDEPYELRGRWAGFSRTLPEAVVETAVSSERLEKVASGLASLPPYFKIHPKLKAVVGRRGRSIREGTGIDWGTAEALAFGSLLLEGLSIRLSGQDSSRGTFSHRHAVLVDQESGEDYVPLDNLTGPQARFEVVDSLLSEAAVLGFEYGYSLVRPDTLTLWEAQFGDFANGAQVVIDQFITSAHVKWGRISGLVLLLPHGYEGQGPEHSSARIERFLQTCAEDSLQVVNCTTAAQYFHVLRRQMLRPYRAPMVIFTPKSLLRSPRAASPLADFTSGHFQPVIDDPLNASDPQAVERILFSFGKVHYDLCDEAEYLDEAARKKVSLVRIEELYPWPGNEIRALLERHPKVAEVFWVQEEPRNMGGWTFVHEVLGEMLPARATLRYAGRPPAASPATGSMRMHVAEQKALVKDAFVDLD